MVWCAPQGPEDIAECGSLKARCKSEHFSFPCRSCVPEDVDRICRRAVIRVPIPMMVHRVRWMVGAMGVLIAVHGCGTVCFLWVASFLGMDSLLTKSLLQGLTVNPCQSSPHSCSLGDWSRVNWSENGFAFGTGSSRGQRLVFSLFRAICPARKQQFTNRHNNQTKAVEKNTAIKDGSNNVAPEGVEEKRVPRQRGLSLATWVEIDLEMVDSGWALWLG